MVSGFKTSPKDLSRMESGDARLMVIFENDDLGRLSFLIAIIDIYFFKEYFVKKLSHLGTKCLINVIDNQ
jgi:hypothetical protein